MKKVKILLVSVLLVLLISGAVCGKTTVTMWSSFGGDEQVPIDKTVEAFNVTHPEIKVESVPVTGINTKLLAAIAAGNPPDFYLCWAGDIWGFGLMDIWMPLEDYAKDWEEANNMKFEDIVWPVLWEQAHFRGHLYNMYLQAYAYGNYYNKRLFGEAGIASAPRTIQEMTVANAKLTKFDTAGKITQMGFHFLESGTSWASQFYCEFFGGSLFNFEEKRFEVDEASVEAWTWIQSIVEQVGADKYIEFAAGFGDWGTPALSITAEKTAMIHQGPWMYIQFDRYVPERDYGWAPWPYKDKEEFSEESNEFPCIAGFDGWAIPVGAEHPKEAFQYMAWMSTPEAQRIYTIPYENSRGSATVPVARSLINDPSFVEQHINPYIVEISKLLNNPMAFREGHIYLSHIWGSLRNPVRDKLLRMDGTPRDLLTELVKQANKKLEEL